MPLSSSIKRKGKTLVDRNLPSSTQSKKWEESQLASLPKGIDTMEQFMLSFLSSAFQEELNQDLTSFVCTSSYQEKVSRIKKLFFEREFLSLFSDESLLLVYALEYVPYRCLCYRDMFMKLDNLSELIDSHSHAESSHVNILSLGAGNGAELVGLIGAAFSRSTKPLHLCIQDLSSYGPVIPLLERGLQSPIALSGTSPIPLTVNLLSPGDLLDSTYLESDSMKHAISSSQVITAMFLLNELLSTSKKGFMKLILFLVKNMRPGSYLLVVDSAGSFSEVKVGNGSSSLSSEGTSDRTYMLFQLLDAIQAFRICESHDAIWYRYPKELASISPFKLQNMRYFLRLYQKK